MISRKGWYKILTLAVSLVLVVAGTEGILRVLDLGYGNQPVVGHPVLHHANPSNYRYRSHSPIGEYGGHLMVYGPRGHRVPDQPPARKITDHNVIVIGDSFVEAHQVDYEHSFVGRLGRVFPDIQFHNYGVPSYRPAVSYIQLRVEERQDLKRSIAVVHLIYSNDSQNDASYTKNAIYDADGELLAMPGQGSKLTEFLRRFYVIRLLRRVQLTVHHMIEVQDQINGVRSFDLSPEAIIQNRYEERNLEAVSRIYLLKIRDFLAARDVPYLLSCVPSKLMSNYRIKSKGTFCDQAREWAAQNDVTYVDLEKDFYAIETPLFFDRDMHFNESGHQVTARAFARHLATLPSFTMPQGED